MTEDAHVTVVPPVADRKPHTETLHGDTRIDDYAWLRAKGTPEVTAYLEAENRYAEARLAATSELQETLYQEALARIQQTDLSVPVLDRGYYYYSRTEEGKQYTTYCRRQGSMEAPEEILLDLNEFADQYPFVGVGAFELSSDASWLAYSLDTTGFRDYTLHIKELATGRHATETVPHVKSVAWATDGRTLFYAIDDDAKRPYRIYRHIVGTPVADDVLVHEETDERFRTSVWQSRSKQFVFIHVSSLTASEVRFVDASRPHDEMQVIAERAPEREYAVGHSGDRFYIRTNDRGRNFRVVWTPVAEPGPENWQEFLPHDPGIMRSSLKVFRDHCVVHEREDGLPHIRVVDLATGDSHRLAFPEPVYNIGGSQNPDFDSAIYRYTYESTITPRSVFDYHIGERQSELRKRAEVLGGYDPDQYQVERRFASAADGTQVPISLVYRRGALDAGPAPLYLQGYGSYGFPYPPRFSHSRISLLDRGVVCAVAHIRGGGEMGKTWHDQGRMLSKMSTFTDFIAVAEHLSTSGCTTSEKLVIKGGSAGGLLMGAVVNMRPDLFRAVVSEVPFVDVINTMLDEELPLTVGEFEEWGNPKEREHYFYIKRYCPYSNVVAQDYPAMLVRTSLNDSQVMYWEPAKYVAKLRAHKTDDNPLLFTVNMAGGHGGSSGRYDRLREIALEYAFVLWQLGLWPTAASSSG